MLTTNNEQKIILSDISNSVLNNKESTQIVAAEPALLLKSPPELGLPASPLPEKECIINSIPPRNV